jgi:hypothetical protein
MSPRIVLRLTELRPDWVLGNFARYSDSGMTPFVSGLPVLTAAFFGVELREVRDAVA